MIRVTAFRWVPPFAQGLVRDLRARWALEEAGLPYEVRLIGFDDQKSDAYRALQPFGQVPALEDGELTLFDSDDKANLGGFSSHELGVNPGRSKTVPVRLPFVAKVSGVFEIELHLTETRGLRIALLTVK